MGFLRLRSTAVAAGCALAAHRASALSDVKTSPPTAEFDCLDGVATASAEWSQAKVAWCHEFGIHVVVQHDCTAGAAKEWSQDKMQWCCTYKGAGCETVPAAGSSAGQDSRSPSAKRIPTAAGHGDKVAGTSKVAEKQADSEDAGAATSATETPADKSQKALQHRAAKAGGPGEATPSQDDASAATAAQPAKPQTDLAGKHAPSSEDATLAKKQEESSVNSAEADAHDKAAPSEEKAPDDRKQPARTSEDHPQAVLKREGDTAAHEGTKATGTTPPTPEKAEGLKEPGAKAAKEHTENLGQGPDSAEKAHDGDAAASSSTHAPEHETPPEKDAGKQPRVDSEPPQPTDSEHAADTSKAKVDAKSEAAHPAAAKTKETQPEKPEDAASKTKDTQPDKPSEEPSKAEQTAPAVKQPVDEAPGGITVTPAPSVQESPAFDAAMEQAVKSAEVGAADGAASVVAAPPADCSEQDVAYYPFDTAGALTVEASAADCQARCASTPACGSFSYWVSLGHCHVQDSASTKQVTSGFQSGPASCQVDPVEQGRQTPSPAAVETDAGEPCFSQEGGAYYPLDLGGTAGIWSQTAYDCQIACQAVPSCARFSWYGLTMTCHLADDSATKLAGLSDANYVTGPKNCPSQLGVAQRKFLQAMPFFQASAPLRPLAMSLAAGLAGLVAAFAVGWRWRSNARAEGFDRILLRDTEWAEEEPLE